MIDKEYQSFYFAIVGQCLHISYFDSKDGNSDFQKKYLMPDTFDNNLNLTILTKFISEKVKDFEKKVGSFIEKVNLITDYNNVQFSLSLKNKYDFNQITQTDIVRLINDAKQLIVRNNKDFFILHILVDRYILDGKEYLEFPENIKFKELIIEVSFITIQNSRVKTLNKILKDCNIEVKKIISHKYSSKFEDKNDTSPCNAGKKIIEGINPSEVTIHSQYTKKLGFFEKMFNFFG